MTEKTITLRSTLLRRKKIYSGRISKEEWRGHPQEIWGFLIDFGTVEEMKFGEKIVELFPKCCRYFKAFNIEFTKKLKKTKMEENKIMSDIEKAIDLTYLRGQVVALYKLKINIMDTIKKLEEKIEKNETKNNNFKNK